MLQINAYDDFEIENGLHKRELKKYQNSEVAASCRREEIYKAMGMLLNELLEDPVFGKAIPFEMYKN